MPFLLVANRRSGTDEDSLLQRAMDELPDVRMLELDDNADLQAAVPEAADSGRTIVAYGGDGTVHAVAQALAGTDGVLGVLPGGTLNHFARDLGLRDEDAAMDALRDGVTMPVDVGRAGTRVFVNSMSLGLYPELVRERDRRTGRLGKWAALATSAAGVVRRFDPIEGTITADGDARAVPPSVVVFVGNNRFSTAPGSIGVRDRLDEGVLDVRIVLARSGLRARSRLAWGMARARSWPGRMVRTVAEEVRIELTDGPQPIALDGEVIGRGTSIDVRIEVAALHVLVPHRR
jgi:diacylglycerol kinase family enzyme